MSQLSINTTSLQEILETVNNLPEASTGVELPTLTTPASEAEVFEGYEYIDQEGAAKVGTFSIDTELETQDDLIAQLQSAVDGLPEAGGVELPDLLNPATSDEILEGYEAVDGNGNLLVGTHVCESGGFENGSFQVYNSTEDLYFALNGVPCDPGTTVTVPYSNFFMQSFLALNNGFIIEDMYFISEIDGEDGEIITDTTNVYCPNLNDDSAFIFCGFVDVSTDCVFGATYS